MIRITGLDRVEASLKATADALSHMTIADNRAAEVVISNAHPPRDTGRLVASIRQYPGAGAIVGSDVPYAAPVEKRTRFLARALEQSQPQVLAVYEQAVAEAS